MVVVIIVDGVKLLVKLGGYVFLVDMFCKNEDY